MTCYRTTTKAATTAQTTLIVTTTVVDTTTAAAATTVVDTTTVAAATTVVDTTTIEAATTGEFYITKPMSTVLFLFIGWSPADAKEKIIFAVSNLLILAHRCFFREKCMSSLHVSL